MSSGLVLITGATGHIGFKAFQDALLAGYSTRLAVRSESKKSTILSNPVFKALNVAEDRVSFVIVPDLTVAHAYDEAVKGVDYILHIASPITEGEEKTQEQYKEFFIKPAIAGTVGILDSAEKEPKVKRIVITSSVVAIREFQGLIGQDDHHVVYASDRVPDDNGPYVAEFHAYSASKVAALNASERWIAEHKPSFDLVNIHPAFVEGRDDLVFDANKAFAGTNGVPLSVATGKTGDSPLPGASVHLEDIARLHVEALDKAKIPAGSYTGQWNPEGTAAGTKWEDINAIVEKNFPEAIKSGVLKLGKQQASIPQYFDSSRTEEVFGWKFQDLEAQVKSVVGHYVELASKA